MPLLPFLAKAGKAVGGALPIVGPLIQSAIDAKQSRRNVDKTIQHQKELQEYQYSKDLEMWEKGNIYNSPTEQMARLRKAGLNPNMVYGTGTVTGNTATNLPKYSAPRPDYTSRKPPIDLMPAMGMYQQMRMNDAQVDLLRSKKQNEDITQAMNIARLPGIKGSSKLKWELSKYATNMAFQQNRKLTWEAGLALMKRKIGGEQWKQNQTRTNIMRIDENWLQTMKQNQIGRTLIPLLRMFLNR